MSGKTETYLEMELRHAKERADLVEQIREEAYLAGLHDKSKPGSIVSKQKTVIEQISVNVCEAYKVSLAQLRGPSKVAPLIEPRRKAWVEAHDRGYSLSQIARYFNRDHTTVRTGIIKQRELDKEKAQTD